MRVRDLTREQRESLARRAVWGSLTLLVFSLPLAAVRGPVGGLGLEMLMLGWLGPMAGHAGWFGNPFLFLTWIIVGGSTQRDPGTKDSVGARATRVLLPVVGVLIASTSVLTLPGADLLTPGTHGVVTALGPGFYLWFGSFGAALAAGIISALPARPLS